MCIMEVHPHQHTSTIAMALAHNTATTVGDLDLFMEVLRTRDPDLLTEVQMIRQVLAGNIYARLLKLYGNCVASDPAHTDPIGSERSREQVDADRAHAYETRKHVDQFEAEAMEAYAHGG